MIQVKSMAAEETRPTVYPIGYSSRYAMQRIDELMRQPNMLLIDTRYKPTSWSPQWRKQTLECVYKKRYRWAGAYLGNVHVHTDQPMELANPEPGVQQLCRYLQQGYQLIILCQCTTYQECHRHLVIDLLLQAMPHIQVIQPETLPEIAGYWCLSTRPPYSHWLSNPALFSAHHIPPKTIENRDWSSRHRGKILIHASQTFESEALAYWGRRLPGLQIVVPQRKKEYVLGAIVGVAQLVDVITESNDPWFCGEYGFVLEDAQPIEPTPYPGALKIFEVPRSIVEPL